MCQDCHERILDQAVAEGRIARSEREGLLRAFAAAPELTAEILVARPVDQLQASRNAWDENAHREYAAEASGRLGIRAEELI